MGRTVSPTHFVVILERKKQGFPNHRLCQPASRPSRRLLYAVITMAANASAVFDVDTYV